MITKDGVSATSRTRIASTRKLYTTYRSILVPFVIAVILILVGQVASPGFAEANHVLQMLKISALLGVLVLAQSVVIIAGGEGIDLSVGAIAGFSAIMAGVIINGQDANFVQGVLIAVAAGFLLGLVNGAGVAMFNVPPLIMTLGMSSVITGMVLIYSQGYIIRGSASALLRTIGGGQLLGLPSMIFVWFVIIAISLFAFYRTKFGITLYGVGANEMTARFDGVHTRRVRALAYGIGGAIAALAGIFLLGYNGLPYMGMGDTYTLPSVAAAVIGGISLAGGSGNYMGAVGGSILLTTLTALLVTLRMGEGGKQIVFGLVLLTLLTLYGRRSRS